VVKKLRENKIFDSDEEDGNKGSTGKRRLKKMNDQEEETKTATDD
jgi:hypothetical protein